jgi:hypothetical protein
MPKYLCLQRSLPGGDASAEKPSPAQMQAMYEKFNHWREKVSGQLGRPRRTPRPRQARAPRPST